jgi:hypothetical protein
VRIEIAFLQRQQIRDEVFLLRARERGHSACGPHAGAIMQSRSATVRFALIVPILIAVGPSPRIAAQQPVAVAYPLDSITGGWANCGPLGQNNTGVCDESRAQMLIPQAYLPSTGGVITGIEVVVTSPYVPSVTYEVLDINMGLTTARSLSTTFANNLPSPIQVLSLRPPNSTINYTPSGWTLLNFKTPFPYGGSGNLVIEFRKSVNQPPQSRVNIRARAHECAQPWQVTLQQALESGAVAARRAGDEVCGAWWLRRLGHAGDTIVRARGSHWRQRARNGHGSR